MNANSGLADLPAGSQ